MIDMADTNYKPVDGHPKMAERKCKVCGVIFAPSAPNRFLCDSEEYNAVSKRLREDSHVCPMCGKTFTSTNKRTKYCSAECQRESSKIQQKIADDKRRKI